MTTDPIISLTDTDDQLRLAEHGISLESLQTELHKFADRPPATFFDARERILRAARNDNGNAVVGGIAAAILLGTAWYDHDFVVELFRHPTGSTKPTSVTKVHRTVLQPDDILEIDGVAVTNPIRTAFDIGRIPPAWRGLGYLDALQRATGFDVDELVYYVSTRKRQRGIRQLRDICPLIDGKAESHPESWLRFIVFGAGLPAPETQIEVFDVDGRLIARLDMGYREFKIGVEYDGEDYHSSPEQLAKDAARDEVLRLLGWHIIRVRKDRMRNTPWQIVIEIKAALRARGAYF